MTQQYMLLFSLGPVQSFIAQARKTRDLWLGSYLLAVLMEAAMEGIKDKKVLIFPDNPEIEGLIPDLPNKYIAIFDEREDAEKAASTSKSDIEARWKKICGDVWTPIITKHRLNDKTTDTIWSRQVNPDRFFEIFWVVVEGDRVKYSEWLTKTQEALGARKRLRHVTMANSTPSYKEEEEQGEKSTISGEREALHRDDSSRAAVVKFWRDVAQYRSVHEINKEGEERLDAIDTVKRFAYLSPIIREKLRKLNEEGEQNVRAIYPSTSTIATATFVESLLRHHVDVKEWITETSGHNLDGMREDVVPYLWNLVKDDSKSQEILKRDGDCYFPETFTSERLEKDYNITPRTEAERVAKAVRKALGILFDQLNQISEQKISRPTPYYAMIQMDGDKMGKLLDDVEDDKEHKKISAALSHFSREAAPRLVHEHYPGRLIYAGGDDVFALAPLARDQRQSVDEPLTVLDLVDQLQKQYHQIVSAPVQGKRKELVTASTGIAIAHHYTSLSYVRRMSKEAEEVAKKKYGRNSLVVTLLRRSGEQTRVGCRWHYNELQQQPIDLFSRFYDLFKNDKLSPKCVYVLLEEAPALVKLEDKKARQSEVRRVLLRQSSDSSLNKELGRLADALIALAEAMDNDMRGSTTETEKKSVELHSEERRYGLVEVLGWIQVIVFLTRGGQE